MHIFLENLNVETAKCIEFLSCYLNSLLGQFLNSEHWFLHLVYNGSCPCAALSYLEGNSMGHKGQESLPMPCGISTVKPQAYTRTVSVSNYWESGEEQQ